MVTLPRIYTRTGDAGRPRLGDMRETTKPDPRLLAYADPDHAPDGPAWEDDEHERVRWCRLLTHHGIAADPGDLLLAPPLPPVGDVDVARFGAATLIHPGAASAARRWPVDRWAAVARHERGRGRDVVVTGGPDEGGLADAVARFAGVGPWAPAQR